MFERLVVWSAASGVLWLAGAALDGDQRLLLWIPALALELAAPAAGYWLPGRGRAATTDYDIEGGHFAERCQLFIIIALGESIVVTGATASAAGLTPTVVLCLVVAFVETAALWWLYFGAAAEHARATMSTCDDPGRLARDAYTYVHLPIVAGIIATAVGNDLLIAAPHDAPRGVGVAMILGGPALYLLGESLFRWRMTGATNASAWRSRRCSSCSCRWAATSKRWRSASSSPRCCPRSAVWELRSADVVGASARPRWRSVGTGTLMTAREIGPKTRSSGPIPAATAANCGEVPFSGWPCAFRRDSPANRADFRGSARLDRTQEVGGSSPPSSIGSEALHVRGLGGRGFESPWLHRNGSDSPCCRAIVGRLVGGMEQSSPATVMGQRPS